MIIDCHHHWIPRKIADSAERFLRQGERIERKGDIVNLYKDGVHVGPIIREESWNVAKQLAHMDAAGVDVAVLHLNVWPEWLTPESAAEINDEMAELVASHPRRFVGLAHVHPLQKGAIEEARRGIRELGFKGIGIISNIDGLPLDSEELWPLYGVAAESGVPIVVHPASMPREHDMLRDFHMARGIGRVYDVMVATARLMTSGCLAKFPDLKFQMPHFGGAFFAVKNRLTPSYYEGGAHPFERYIKQIYFDTAPALWGESELRCAVEVLGADRIVLGSDYPLSLSFMSDAVSLVNGLRADAETREQLMWKNAAGLFGIEDRAHSL